VGAIWYRARSELRRRWAGTIVLALLVGVAGGAVLTAVAGARRTDTALDRFVEYHRPTTLELGLGSEGLDPEAVARLPQVAATGRAAYVLMAPARPDGTPDPDAAGVVNPFLLLPEHGSSNRALVVRGRLPDDEQQPLEISVDERLADRFGVGPGDRFPMWGYAPGQLGLAATGGEGPIAPEGPRMDFLVTAVVRAPHDVVAREIDQDVLYAGDAEMYVGPAWYERYGDEVAAFGPQGGLSVRLERDRSDVSAFEAAVRRLPGGAAAELDVDSEAARARGAVRNAIDIQVTGLYLFAAIAAVAGLLVVGQALGRELAIDPQERTDLRALGFSSTALAASTLVRAVVVAVLGAVLAVGAAVLASPLTPIGLARKAEIDPGIRLDGPVLALGALAVVAAVLLRAGLSALADARRRAPVAVPTGRTSALAESLSRSGASASLVSGVRAALEPGGGRRALSLRTALVGAGLAAGAVIAAFGFTASLDRLTSSPARQGWAWDVTVGNGQDEDPEGMARFEAEGVERLERQPVVGGVARVTDPAQADVGDTRLPVFGITADRPEAFFPVVEGRAPTGPDEMALGRQSLRATGLGVGDRATVTLAGRTRQVRVVGEMALFDPEVGEQLGEGALVTREGIRALGADPAVRRFLVNYADGVSDAEGYAALRRDWGRTVLQPMSATDVANLDAVGGLPFILAGLVGVLAVAALGHALVGSVRRRRRDLAVLRTIGFVGRQLRASVAWQATTLVALALALGLPLGVAAGRWVWRLVAESLGTALGPVTPLAVVVLVVPAMLLLANLIAAIPARSAARTEPATVLRSE
jgi:hypothetical protein